MARDFSRTGLRAQALHERAQRVRVRVPARGRLRRLHLGHDAFLRGDLRHRRLAARDRALGHDGGELAGGPAHPSLWQHL